MENKEKEFTVRYEDFTGAEDIATYPTESAAEEAIKNELEDCEEYLQSKEYKCKDFGRKTEIWVPDGNEYASWERLWK